MGIIRSNIEHCRVDVHRFSLVGSSFLNLLFFNYYHTFYGINISCLKIFVDFTFSTSYSYPIRFVPISSTNYVIISLLISFSLTQRSVWPKTMSPFLGRRYYLHPNLLKASGVDAIKAVSSRNRNTDFGIPFKINCVETIMSIFIELFMIWIFQQHTLCSYPAGKRDIMFL